MKYCSIHVLHGRVFVLVTAAAIQYSLLNLSGSVHLFHSGLAIMKSRDFFHGMLFSALIVHEYVEWSDPTSACLLVQSCSQVSHNSLSHDIVA